MDKKVLGSGEVKDRFLETLVQDLIAAFERLRDDTPRHRREAIRATFAAVEGLAWLYRQHVRIALESLEESNPLIELALVEKSYAVSEKGVITEQQRFISVIAMIRLTTRLVQKIWPAFDPQFGTAEWAQLKEALSCRNRLAHPKAMSDLHVSADDIVRAKAGFFWLLDLVVEGMAVSNQAMRQFNADCASFVEQLQAGDEQATAEYLAALAEDIN